MNSKILTSLIAAALISGCSSMYKATSTPDDIYYSAPPAQVAATGSDAGYDRYDNYQTNNDDQYLRMKVQNPNQWASIDDYSYWNDSRYDFGYSCDASRSMLFSTLYNPYGYGFGSYFGYGLAFGGYGGGFGFGYGWSSWASPYQTIVLYRNPKVYFGSTSKSNLTAYRNIQYSNYNNGKFATTGGYQNGNYTTRGSNFNTSSSNNNNAPARTFSSSSSSNSAGGRSGGFSSSGSSSGGARVSRH